MAGIAFLPFSANAGIFSSIIGNNALASENDVYNSQNMALLEVSTSPFLVTDSEVDLINIDSENALIPATSPLGVFDGTEEVVDPSYLNVYVVKKGDTLATIAKMMDVSVDTILSFNEMKKGDQPKEGEVLLIPSFAGVEHTVVKGDTLKGLATLYGVDVNEIVFYNIDIDSNSKLAIGDKVIIPGASMLKEKKITPSKSIAKGSAGNLKNISGYFMYPLPSGPRIRKTQGLHDRYAVDIGAPTGTPIYASASGNVTFAKNGWNGAYGNVVFIKHPNGTETRYAHMSQIATTPGKYVNQGDLIGYVGSTGRSTGPHLHFEVRGARNPF